MIKAVIFDLDGLLADTESLHCQAYQKALREHGVALSQSDYAEHWVRNGLGIGDWVKLQGLDLEPLAVRTRKARHFLELLTASLRPMDGALQLLAVLRGKLPIALASSSYRDAIDGVITGLGISDYFEVIVSGLDVSKVKPAPDIFLKAAAMLGVDAAECIVLEDAEKGVIAANLAGMRCIAVPNDLTRHHDFSRATCVCRSLSEVSMELLQGLSSESA